jgi:electron transfer flavoprotein alpha subunit
MLRSLNSFSVARRVIYRTYATAALPHALVLLEHRNGSIEPSSLAALSAANQLGGQVTGLVVGGPGQVDGIVEAAKKCVHPLCFENLRCNR